MPRRVTKLFNARQQSEGAGFIVRRPIGAVRLCALSCWGTQRLDAHALARA